MRVLCGDDVERRGSSPSASPPLRLRATTGGARTEIALCHFLVFRGFFFFSSSRFVESYLIHSHT